MEEDLVYGIAGESDVFLDAAGKVTFPMYQVKIAGVGEDELTELKTYEKTGYYVEDIRIEGSTMYLNRVRYNGTAYVSADMDMIMNREREEGKFVTVVTSESEEKQTQVQLKFAEEQQ